MEKYNWDRLFDRAKQLAGEWDGPTDLAELLGVPRTTLASALDRHDVTLASLMAEANTIQEVTIKKLQLQNKYLRRHIDDLEGERARQVWWKETVLEAASMMPVQTVNPPKLEKGKMSPQTAILHLSDIHMGQHTPAEQLGIFGRYDSAIAESRIKYTFTTFTKLAHQQPFPIEEVVVAADGDFVEHSHLRAGHEQYVDQNTIKQTLSVSNIVGAGVSMLAGQFPKVRFVGVPGNHGRLTDDPRRSDPTENFDYMAYRVIEKMLQDQENVEFIIPESWYENFRIYGYNFFMIHGEDIRSYAGFPWYGATRAARKYVAMFRATQRDLIRKNKPTTPEEWQDCLIVPDYALLAHFHSSTTWEAPDVEHFVNGSMPGVSKYGTKRRMVLNRPSQRMYFVHRDYGVALRCPIYLDRAP